MSWKPEVQTDLTGQWHGNGLRFLTHKEAEATTRNLMKAPALGSLNSRD